MAVNVNFGSGGAYSTLQAAINATLTATADTFNYYQVGNSVETGSVFIELKITGQNVNIINNSPHAGNPNSGYTISGNFQYLFILRGSNTRSGTISLIDLNISSTANAPSTAIVIIDSFGSSYWATKFVFNRCIIRDMNNAGPAINNQGMPVNVFDCKLYRKVSFNISAPPGLTHASVCTFENNTMDGEFSVGGYAAVFRNNVANTYSSITGVKGYNNARIGGALSDANFASGSSGNIGNLVSVGEYFSTDKTNDQYLFIKTTGSLANGGMLPVSVAADIAGVPIPDYAGWYPIGCHCANTEPTTTISPVDFPEMIIDSGAVYKDYGLPTEKLIGATRGGNKFYIDQKIEDLGYDGRGANVEGGKRIMFVQPYIEANIIEVSADLINDALPASEKSALADQDKITRALQIALSDYCDNITIVGEVWGKNYPIVCIVKNALCVSNFELKTADKNESVIALKFAGHFDESDLSTEPWEIRYPRE